MCANYLYIVYFLRAPRNHLAAIHLLDDSSFDTHIRILETAATRCCGAAVFVDIIGC